MGHCRERFEGLLSWAFDFRDSPMLSIFSPPFDEPDAIRMPSDPSKGLFGVSSSDFMQLTVYRLDSSGIAEICQMPAGVGGPFMERIQSEDLSEMETLSLKLELFARAHQFRMMNVISIRRSEAETRQGTESRFSEALAVPFARALNNSERSLVKQEHRELNYHSPRWLAVEYLLCWAYSTGWSRFLRDHPEYTGDFPLRIVSGYSAKYARKRHVHQGYSFLTRAAHSSREGSRISLHNGFLAIEVGDIALDDMVLLVHGSRHALIVRDYPDGLRLRGIACVQGGMEGELLEVCKGIEIEDEEFVLI